MTRVNENISIEQAILEEKRRYAKAWREKNKDKVREINRRYWEKKARERLAKEQEAEDDEHAE